MEAQEKAQTTIDPAILDREIDGYRLDSHRFGDLLCADRPVLLAFLRHFG